MRRVVTVFRTAPKQAWRWVATWLAIVAVLGVAWDARRRVGRVENAPKVVYQWGKENSDARNGLDKSHER